MANKPLNRHTTETILELISNHLSVEQKQELRDELIRQVGNPITASSMLYEGAKIKQHQLKDELDYKTEVLTKKEQELKDAEKEIGNGIPKRTMSKERIETAKAFLRLRKDGTKQIVARHALANSPLERNKAYAKDYHSTKDEEKLRNYVKAVVRDYEKHKFRLSFSKSK